MREGKSAGCRSEILTVGLFDADVKCRAALRKDMEGTNAVAVLHEGERCDEVIDACQQQCPNVVCLGMYLDDLMSGMEVGMQLRQHYPELPIIYYNVYYNVRRCIAGLNLLPIIRDGSHYAALSAISNWTAEQLLLIIKEINDGHVIIEPDIAWNLRNIRQYAVDSRLNKLSQIEHEVLERLALGLSDDYIASELGLRDGSVLMCVYNSIYAKWGLHSSIDEKLARSQAAFIYLSSIK